jgi:hypothetical protein
LRVLPYLPSSSKRRRTSCGMHARSPAAAAGLEQGGLEVVRQGGSTSDGLAAADNGLCACATA